MNYVMTSQIRRWCLFALRTAATGTIRPSPCSRVPPALFSGLHAPLRSASAAAPDRFADDRAAARKERDDLEPRMDPATPRIYKVIGSERDGPNGDPENASLPVIFGVHGPDPASWAWGVSADSPVARVARGEVVQEDLAQSVFAVIESGSRQFKVTEGDVVYVDKIPGDVNTSVTFPRVLLVGSMKWTAIGRPYVTGAKVEATVEEQTRLAKTYKFVFRKRKNSKRLKGHRQPITRVRINRVEYEVPADDDLRLLGRSARQPHPTFLSRKWHLAMSQ